jgi:tRNA-splicing ligase RtcB
MQLQVIGGVVAASIVILGYAEPVSGVIAYERQVSLTGIDLDIGCGSFYSSAIRPHAR